MRIGMEPTLHIESQMSNEKEPGCLGYLGDYTTQLCGIIINHYEDPY